MRKHRWLVAVPLLILLSGCISIPFVGSRPAGQMEKGKRIVKTSTVVQDVKGKKVGYNTTFDYETNLKQTTPKKTFRQWLAGKILGMGIIMFILWWVGGPALITALVVWLIRSKRVVVRATREIIQGIKAAGVATKDGQPLHDHLRKPGVLSPGTKKIIALEKTKL